MHRCTCVHLHTHIACVHMHTYAYVCVCVCVYIYIYIYIYTCVYIHTHHLFQNHYRYTGDGWFILKSGWKVYKLIPHDVTAWLWGPGIEVATTLELGCGRDLCCVKNVPRRVLPPPGRALLCWPRSLEVWVEGGKPLYPTCQVQSWPSNKVSHTSLQNTFLLQTHNLGLLKSCTCK